MLTFIPHKINEDYNKVEYFRVNKELCDNELYKDLSPTAILLYSLLCEKDFKEATNFGWATGVMAVTCLDDYATPIDEDQVISIYKGNARVKR